MIFDIAERRAELTPHRPAVYFAEHWYTYAELNARASRLAARLAADGVTKGDRVSILAYNHLAHLELILASAKLGFIYTPLNYRLASNEQQKLAAYVKPRLLFYDADDAAKARATGVPLVALADYQTWLLAAPLKVPATPTLSPEDTQMILFTGGTTGLPKGAMLPYRQGFYNAVNTILSWGLREDDCVIQATPCFHAAVNVFTMPLLHLGARVVLQRTFDPGEYLQLVADHRCSILFLIPTMYQMLAEHAAFPSMDLSSVRWAISGGAPCPEPVRKAFMARGVKFKQGYGMTEAGVNCFALDLEDAEARPASVGKPVLHASAVIRDAAGKPVVPGETGELTLKGPHLFTGYFERPDATQEVLREGWLWTGDLARQDAEGFFYIAGRRKEMFISGGENVFPVEIEQALYEHPAVAECAVVGIPDDRWGEVGLAGVVLRANRQVSEIVLKDYLKTRLASYKVPKYIVMLAELPKSGAGKILKSALVTTFSKERHAAS